MTIKTELYRFVMDQLVWTYTSGNKAVVYNSETYQPIVISRKKTESSQELTKAGIQVLIDIESDLGQRLLDIFTEKVLSLTLYDQSNGTTTVFWKGRLAGIAPAMEKINLEFESILSVLRRTALQPRMTRRCRHVIYRRGCNVDPNNFAVAGEADNVSGAVVTISEAAGFDDGYFYTGFLLTSDGISGYIVGHSGSEITLQRPLESLLRDYQSKGYGNNYGRTYGGTILVTIHPGCDLSRTVCDVVFDNLDNNGSFLIPSRNPMDGSRIV